MHCFSEILLISLYNNCIGAGRPNPNAVRIEGCSVMPCSAPQGKDIVMEMDFTTITTVRTLTPTVRATALGVVTPYPLPEELKNGCKALINASCPLDARESATYKIVFPISKIYPTIPVTVELTVSDERGSAVACFAVDIRVTHGFWK